MNDPILEALNRSALEVTPEDIDKIVAFLRKSRLQLDVGAKPKKEGADIDIAKALGINISIAKGPKDRRF